jgi:hypothetical protein
MADNFEKFARNFEAADTDVSNLFRYLSTEFGTPAMQWTSEGLQFTPVRDLYGDNFANASPEARREFLEKVDKGVMDIKYPDLKDETEFSSFAGGAGTVLGSIMSPTSLFPIYRMGKGITNLLGVSAQSGLWAAEYNFFHQLARDGMIDEKELASVGAAGAIATPLVAKVVGDVITSPASTWTAKQLGTILSPISSTAKAILPPYRRNVTPSAIKKADSDFDQVSDAIIEAKSKGVGVNPAQEAAHAEIMMLQRQVARRGRRLKDGERVPSGYSYDNRAGKIFSPEERAAVDQIKRELLTKQTNYHSNFAPIKSDISDDLIEAAALKTNKTSDEIKEVLQLSSNKPFQGTRSEARSLIDAVESNADPIASAYKNNWRSSGSNWLGVWSTELEKVFPSLQKIIRKGDVDKAIKTNNIGKSLNPFVKIQKSIDAKEGGNFELALFNADTQAINKYLKKYKNIKVKGVSQTPSQAYSAYRKTMDSLHKELQDAGVDVNYIKDYYPRKIKDFDGLIKELGFPRSKIEQQWKARAKELGIQEDKLNDFEKANILNRVLRGKRKDPSISSLTNKKQRELISVTERTKKYYEKSDVSLDRYVRDSLDEIELRRLFGRSGKDSFDLGDSIGGVLAKGRAKNLFSPDDEFRIESLLKARYGEGRKSPSAVNRFLSNSGYAGTLANPLSAITQIGDVATSAGLNGVLRTILNTAPWARRVKYEDLGLDGLLAEMGTTRGGVWLDRLFKTSGFAQVDKWGKNTFLNAALDKLISQSKTTKGVEKLKSKYGVMFGDDFKTLVGNLRSLKKGDIVNDRIKSALLSELADAQPILKSEMPTSWLRNPELRIAWQLKSFALKQLDIMRREIWQKLQSSNPATRREGAKMLVVYPPLLIAGGATTTAMKDILLGRPDALDPDKFDDKFAESLIKIFGANKYMLRQTSLDGGGTALVDYITPPVVGMIDGLLSMAGAASGLKEDSLGEAFFEDASNYTPFFGRFWYNTYGGGLQRYKERMWEEPDGLDRAFDILNNN